MGGKKAAMKRRKSAQTSVPRSIVPKKRQVDDDDGYAADDSPPKSMKRSRPPNSRKSSAKQRARSDDSYADMDSTPPADPPTQKRTRLAVAIDDVEKRSADGSEYEYRPSISPLPEAAIGGPAVRKAARRASFRKPKPTRAPDSSDEESAPEINIFSDEHALKPDPATTFSESGRPQRRSAISAHQSTFSSSMLPLPALSKPLFS